MTAFDPDRRKILMAGGVAATIALAGCSGGGGDGGDDGSGDDGSEDGGDDGSGDDGSEDGGDDGSGDDGSEDGGATGDFEFSGEVPDEVDAYLTGDNDYEVETNNYDGQIAEATGVDSVTVRNGANEPDFAFDPAAIRVSEGTEVTWEWVSDGHNVSHQGDDFESEIEDEGFSFSQTFDQAGTYLYQCIPHGAVGQLGAVVVE